MSVKLNSLPSVLALPLQAYFDETHPNLKLYRLCEATEIVTRLCAITSLAELRAQRGDQSLPEPLQEWLQSHIERPTFGLWCELLKLCVASLDRAAEVAAPEYLSFIAESLYTLIGSDFESGESTVVQLRNDLFHGGAMTKSAAQQLLSNWEARFGRMADDLTRLANVAFCWLDGGRAYRLIGPLAECGPEIELSVALRNSIGSRDGHVVLILGEHWLDLWPLCDYGPADANADSPGPLVYARAERDRLLYAALGVDWPHAERSDFVQQFRELFRLDERSSVKPIIAADFEAEIRTDTLALIGRVTDLRQAKQIIKNTQSGVLWIGGPAGIGKSFFMAKLATDLAGDPKKGCRIAWRFRASDGDRCTRSAFFRHAIEKLAEWLEKPEIAPAADPNERLTQLRQLLSEASSRPAADPRGKPPRVLLVLDGLDEIDRVDLGFAQIPFMMCIPNVVWLCAGRPERGLPQIFAPDRCAHVFPDGLPPMSDADVRGMLLDGTGNLKFELLKLDKEKVDATVKNVAVEAVVKRAAGLPLYVHYVVQDIVAGHFRFDDLSRKLPPSLNDYYDDLLRRLGIGELPALVTQLVVTLAWAHAPLDEKTLHLLMVRRGVATNDDAGRALLRRGLTAVRGMIRHAVTPNGRDGYEPYHFSFCEHIRQDPKGEIGVQNALTRDSLCDFVCDWAALPADHPARDYALRFGPRTLLEPERLDEAEAMLTSHKFLEAKAEAGLGYELLDDLTLAPNSFKTRSTLVKLISESFRPAVHFVVRHPSELFQCLWNNGWWHDGLAIADIRPIADWLDAWRAERDQDSGSRVWLRSLRQPVHGIGSPLVAVLPGHTDAVNAVAFSPDGSTLVSGGSDHTVRIWDVGLAAEIATFAVPETYPRPVESLLLNRPWSTDSREPNADNRITAVAFSADGKLVFAGSDDGVVRAWNVESKALELTADFEFERENMTGEGMAANLDDVRHAQQIFGVGGGVASMQLCPGRLVILTHAGLIREWDFEQTNLRWFGVGASRFCAAADSKRQTFAFERRSGGLEGTGSNVIDIYGIDGSECRELSVIEGHESRVTCLAFELECGGALASGSADLTVRVWDVYTGSENCCLRGHTGAVRAVAMSQCGDRVVSTGDDKAVRVWDVGSKRPVTTLFGHSGPVIAVAYSADGSFFASGSEDQTIRVWSAARAEVAGLPPDHPEPVTLVTVSSDGVTVASGSEDGTICIWDAPTATVLTRLTGHVDRITAVAFLYGGRLVSASWDGTVRLWDLSSAAEVARLGEVVNRGLRAEEEREGMWRLMNGESTRFPWRVTDVVPIRSQTAVAYWRSGDALEWELPPGEEKNPFPDRPNRECAWNALPLYEVVIRDGETAVVQNSTREVVARIPDRLVYAKATPDPAIIVGAIGNNVCFFALENAATRDSRPI